MTPGTDRSNKRNRSQKATLYTPVFTFLFYICYTEFMRTKIFYDHQPDYRCVFYLLFDNFVHFGLPRQHSTSLSESFIYLRDVQIVSLSFWKVYFLKNFRIFYRKTKHLNEDSIKRVSWLKIMASSSKK